MTYLHGQGGLLPGLESALEGKQVDDNLEVTLTPDQAFGERSPDAEQRIPLKHLGGAKQWQPGMTATVNTQQGHRQVTIIKVGHTMATVDTNHPLAGKTLTFNLTVAEVREASAEELHHGHAHGPGGHHH
jgi:FKBP-type peptidyl-prolyl cis-trans isomerase SlyD